MNELKRIPSKKRSCQGKRRFETLELAERAIYIQWTRYILYPEMQLGELHAYKCIYCDYYHIGHPMREDGKTDNGEM